MFSGVLKKMISIHDNPVRYILDFDNDLLFLNQVIGKNLKINYIKKEFSYEIYLN